jgi:coenzyme PQQ precursor peptide PqqA
MPRRPRRARLPVHNLQDRPDFVTMRIGGTASAAGISSNRDIHRRRRIMTWQTPQAIDVRLGFEITMYISNR